MFTPTCLCHQAGLVEGQWRSLAGKVTAGLAESNGSLPPGDDLKGHLQADCLYTGISSGPTLGNEYGKTLPLTYTYLQTRKHSRNDVLSNMWTLASGESRIASMKIGGRNFARRILIFGPLSLSASNLANRSAVFWRAVELLELQ